MWTQHPEYKDYEISTMGQVRSKGKHVFCVTPQGGPSIRWIKGRVLRVHKTPDGYPFVTIYHQGTRVMKLIHTLVYRTFRGTIPEGYVISHKDKDLTNCSPDNLVLSTQSINIRDSNMGRLRGIERYKKTTRWSARISIRGKRVFLGVYDSKRDAYTAYYHAYLKMFNKEPFDLGLI